MVIGNDMKNKDKIIRIRYYPSFLYFLLERWLSKMSLRGWELVSRHIGVVYRFEKSTPKSREYFVWEPTRIGEGKYSIPMRYPFLEIHYGVKKKYSKLNKHSHIKHDTIIEVDTRKIDVDNDTDYLELKRDRNKLYTLFFVRNIIVLAFVVLVFVVVNFFLRK